MMDYKNKKVLNMGAVEELTGLTARQIRYYEERKLIFPERSKGGTRKYSFSDVEKLVGINEKVKRGESTFVIRQDERRVEKEDIRKKMIQGQINSHFRRF